MFPPFPKRFPQRQRLFPTVSVSAIRFQGISPPIRIGDRCLCTPPQSGSRRYSTQFHSCPQSFGGFPLRCCKLFFRESWQLKITNYELKITNFRVCNLFLRNLQIYIKFSNYTQTDKNFWGRRTKKPHLAYIFFLGRDNLFTFHISQKKCIFATLVNQTQF